MVAMFGQGFDSPRLHPRGKLKNFPLFFPRIIAFSLLISIRYVQAFLLMLGSIGTVFIVQILLEFSTPDTIGVCARIIFIYNVCELGTTV